MISIVIPTGLKKSSRNVTFLETLLVSIMETSDIEFEVIVVFDDSADAQTLIKNLILKFGILVRFYSFNSSFNFSKKVNFGLDKCNFEYCLILNDDMHFMIDDWGSKIIRDLSLYPDAIVGAKLLYPDLKIQHIGVEVNSQSLSHYMAHLSHDDSRISDYLTDGTYQVSAVTGAFMAMRQNLWDELGGFDELFPVNFGDIDFCLRARANGKVVLQDNSISMIHYESATRRAGAESQEINLFYSRWNNLPERDPFIRKLAIKRFF